jgi:hypothetical protein
MCDWVNGLEAGPIRRLKLRQQVLFARDCPEIVQGRFGNF